MDEDTIKRAMCSALEEHTDTVADRVVSKLASDPPPFWVAGEKHFADHLRLDWWFKTADIAAKTVVALLATSAIVGLAWLIVRNVGLKT